MENTNNKSFEEELAVFNERSKEVYGQHVTPVQIEDSNELQRTEQWRMDRAGNFTGSEFDKLMATKIRKTIKNPRDWRVKSWICSFGDGAFTYIIEKAIERVTGAPKREVKSPYMDWGTNHEDEGRNKAAARLGVEIQDVGFIKFCKNGGASTDGKMQMKKRRKGFAISVKKKGYELKCPATQLKHYKHMNTKVNEDHEYWWQIIAGMMALKTKYLVFCTYDPSFPEDLQLGFKNVKISPIHCRALLVRCVIGEKLINRLLESRFRCDLQKELELIIIDIPSDYMGVKKWLKDERKKLTI